MDTHQPREARPAHWAAPAADGPVRARLTLPGSKSMTNRALVLAALADGPGIIEGPLRARDTLLMARALTALGAAVEAGAGEPAGPDAAERWRVIPGQPDGDTRVDVGNAGTVMRFGPPVAALTGVAVEFHGDARASERPVAPILAALRDLGAVIDDGRRGAVPFTVRGSGSLAGGVVTLDASASSQLVSGLLLAAPRYDKGAEVRHRGGRVPSAPHIAMTVQMLRQAGAEVETACRQPDQPGHPACDGVADTWRVHPGVIGSRTQSVEPDVVNAVPFLAAALVTGGSVTIRDWPRQTTQPAAQIVDLLTRIGARCETTADGLAVTGTGTVDGITADLGDVPELASVLAAVAALAGSPSRLTGIAHIRRQETDRLAALATEINALGGGVTELADGLAIDPRPLRGGVFASYDDHRLVMAAAVLGLAVPGIEVQNAATVGKTFPEFTRLWAAMLEGAP
jgi:3-phosphoshikimate 1-carboxyvinyltransferase